MSEVLRYDLARHHIGVSLVCPGGVDTGLVNTIEIVGVDQQQPAVQKMKAHFRRAAVTPDKAIIRGIKRNRYLGFTSPDVRWAIGSSANSRCLTNGS